VALTTAAGQQSRGVADALTQQSSQLKGRAALAVADAKGRSGQFAWQAKGRAPELRTVVGQSLLPRVKELQDLAVPLFGSATGALASTLEAGKGLASETRHLSDRDLVPALKEMAGTASKSIGGMASQASGSWSGVSSSVDERSRTAAHAAAQGTKDTGALAAWSVAAGGLIYYGLMDEEQKEKARAAAGRIVHEAREIYRDIQGEQ